MRRPTSRIAALLLGLVLAFACAPAPEPRPEIVEEADRLAGQGSEFFNRGCYEKAREYFELALETCRLLDDVEGILRAHNNIGATWLAEGRLDDAAWNLAKALELAQTVEKSSQEPLIYGNLGAAAFKAGKNDEAESMWRKAVDLAETLPVQPGLPLNLTNLGALYRDRKKYDQAEEFLQKAETAAQAPGQVRQLAGIQVQIGYLAEDRGDSAGAEKRLIRALELDKEGEHPRGVARDLEALGVHFQKREMWREAFEYLDRAIHLQAALGNPEKVKEIHELLKTNHGSGGIPSAMDLYDELLGADEEQSQSLLCR